jgi:acyl dehydratase
MATQLKSVNLYFDEVQVGDHFRTAEHEITAMDIDRFCELSGDFSPQHLSDEGARKVGFGGRIAHGLLILSIGTGLVFDLGGSMDKVIAFYGMDRVRFTRPVRIGDVIHMEGEIIELTDKGEKGGVIKRRDSFRNQNDEVVAVVEKSTLNAKRRKG